MTDFSIPVSAYASKVKQNPTELAKKFAETINGSDKKSIIASATSEKIFLNIKANRVPIIKNSIDTVLSLGSSFGSSTQSVPKKIIVEHTSSNPNAPLHIGNLRNVLIGAHLARLLRWVGYESKEFFFVNDLGIQIGLTALGYQYVVNEPGYENIKRDFYIGRVYSIMNTFNDSVKIGLDPIQLLEYVKPKVQNPGFFELDDFVEDEIEGEFLTKDAAKEKDLKLISMSLYRRSYQLFIKLAELFTGKDVPNLAGELNRKYEEKNPEAVRIIRNMVNDTLTNVQATLNIFGVKHDQFDYESEISWDGTSSKLLSVFQQVSTFHPQTESNSKGVPEGAYLDLDSFLTSIGEKRGKGGYQPDYPPFYVLRPDGSTLYTFRDVAYSMKKLQLADLVLNVICTEQNLPQEKVSVTLQALGIEGRHQFHMAYELVKLFRNGEVVRMSGRKGIFVLADSIYNETKKVSLNLLAERKTDKHVNISDSDETENIAHVVASASVKYAILYAPPRSMINFDVVKACDPKGNTGAFILYAAARMASILKKYETRIASGQYPPEPEQINYDCLNTPEVWNILTKFILPFASQCRKAAMPEIPPAPKLPEFGTQVVPQFAYSLACQFSVFYSSTPVLSGDQEMYAKIKFVRATHQVLVNALKLFMVEPLEAM